LVNLAYRSQDNAPYVYSQKEKLNQNWKFFSKKNTSMGKPKTIEKFYLITKLEINFFSEKIINYNTRKYFLSLKNARVYVR